MRCSSSRRHFAALLEGAVSPRCERSIGAHLDACEDCRLLLDELRAVDAVLLRPPAVELPPNFTQRILAETHALPAPRRPRVPVLAFLTAYLAIAWIAVALLLVFAGPQTRATLDALLATAGREVGVIAFVAHAAARALGSTLSELTALSAGALLLDVVAGGVLALAYVLLRPRREARRARSETAQ